MVAADFDDVVAGTTVWEALEPWHYSKAVVSAKGRFKRAGGFQFVLDSLVTTPANDSILFFVDTDMVTYPGFLNKVVKHTVEGKVGCVCVRALHLAKPQPLTPHTSHLTPHTSHLTPHTSHLTPHASSCRPHT
jgi:hypothetical protein